MTFTFLTRPYCGLCRQMLSELEAFQAAEHFTLKIVEIDDFPELEAKYNEFVPVLLHGEEEIFHWYFDQEKLLNFIQKHQNVQAA